MVREREILVVAEHRGKELREVTLEMLRKAKQLSGQAGYRVSLAILGYGISDLVEEASWFGMDKVYYLKHRELEHYCLDCYKDALKGLIEEENPLLVLIGHTATGMDFAPSVAMSLNLPLATDCIDLELIDSGLKVTRQVYGGKVNVELQVKPHKSYIVTLRPTVFRPAEKTERKAQIVEITPRLGRPRTRFVRYVKPEIADIDISQAELIVSVGRGIGERENIKLVEELAEAIGGVLAASRPIVDSGWLPKTRQVGQSGKTVKPKLYLAIGISGSTQHVMGMKNSEFIVAINKDRNAPIFDIADVGIVSDLFEVVPALIELLKEK